MGFRAESLGFRAQGLGCLTCRTLGCPLPAKLAYIRVFPMPSTSVTSTCNIWTCAAFNEQELQHDQNHTYASDGLGKGR